jgi:hypothetical protein
MHSPRGHIALQPRLHPLQDRTTIGVFIETQYLEKHCLLKCSEHVCHNGYIVGFNTTLSTLPFANVKQLPAMPETFVGWEWS